MVTSIPPTEKLCPKCGQVKPISAFYSSRKSTIPQSYCVPCMRRYNSDRLEKRQQFPEGMKRCSRCREIKPFDAFFHDKNTRDGYGYECKACNKVRMNALVPSLAAVPHTPIRKSKVKLPPEQLPEGQKRCRKCLEVKPYSEFPRKAKNSDGYYAYCKACERERRPSSYYIPERQCCKICGQEKDAGEFYLVRGKGRNALSQPCRECAKPVARERSRTYSSFKKRRSQLKSLYGLSLEDYECLLEEQGHVCASCGQPETTIMYGQVVPLAVDHDAQTGCVRGLLCRACNMSFGLMSEDAARIEGLLRYARHQVTIKNGGG